MHSSRNDWKVNPFVDGTYLDVMRLSTKVFLVLQAAAHLSVLYRGKNIEL